MQAHALQRINPSDNQAAVPRWCHSWFQQNSWCPVNSPQDGSDCSAQVWSEASGCSMLTDTASCPTSRVTSEDRSLSGGPHEKQMVKQWLYKGHAKREADGSQRSSPWDNNFMQIKPGEKCRTESEAEQSAGSQLHPKKFSGFRHFTALRS